MQDEIAGGDCTGQQQYRALPLYQSNPLAGQGEHTLWTTLPLQRGGAHTRVSNVVKHLEGLAHAAVDVDSEQPHKALVRPAPPALLLLQCCRPIRNRCGIRLCMTD